MRKSIIFLCLTLWIASIRLSAQGALLYQEGNYDMALVELLRVHYFDREGENHKVVHDIARCFDNIGDRPNALKYYNKYARNRQAPEVDKLDAMYAKVRLLARGNPKLAQVELYELSAKQINLDPDRYYYFDAMIDYLVGDVTACSQSLSRLSYSSKLDEDQLDDWIVKAQKNKNKKHLRSRFLSAAVPGLGQTVNGELVDGLNSAAINGTMVVIFAQVARSLNLVDAILSVGPWFGRFYIGGMSNAVIASKKKQAIRDRQYLEELNSMLIEAQGLH